MATANQTGIIAGQKNTKTENALQKAKKMSFSAFIGNDNTQKAIMNTLQDAARTKTFTSSLISAVTTNPNLMECDSTSIISAALLGESLNLSPSPQLGHYYMVPFNDTKTGVKKAQFQLGWKGYYQLALRSGQYKNIDAVAIKEGELVSFNPITGSVELKPIEDPVEREKAKTVGYYAFFEMINGFRKEMYWSKEKMEAHALKFSQGYRAKKGYTFWERDFDAMALKTMYRQLISKYGIMSIEMQRAYVNDMAVHNVIDSTDTPEYIDADVTEGVIDVVPETGEVAS